MQLADLLQTLPVPSVTSNNTFVDQNGVPIPNIFGLPYHIQIELFTKKSSTTTSNGELHTVVAILFSLFSFRRAFCGISLVENILNF